MICLRKLKTRSSNQGLNKVSYGEIQNELVNPYVPMREYMKRFEVPKIDKFKSK